MDPSGTPTHVPRAPTINIIEKTYIQGIRRPEVSAIAPKIGALIPINKPDAERHIDHIVWAFAFDASISMPDATK